MGDGLMCHYCRRYRCICPEAVAPTEAPESAAPSATEEAPKTKRVKEVASRVADELAAKGFHRDCGNYNRLVIENELETIAEVVQLATELEQVTRERDALKDWKQSAISVAPPLQKIGKALNIGLGESIHDKILPGIEGLTQRAEAAEQERDAVVVLLRGKCSDREWDALPAELKDVLPAECPHCDICREKRELRMRAALGVKHG